MFILDLNFLPSRISDPGVKKSTGSRIRIRDLFLVPDRVFVVPDSYCKSNPGRYSEPSEESSGPPERTFASPFSVIIAFSTGCKYNLMTYITFVRKSSSSSERIVPAQGLQTRTICPFFKPVVEFCLESRHEGSPEVRVMRDAEIDQSTSIHFHVPDDQSLFTNRLIQKKYISLSRIGRNGNRGFGC
jgi:hypothetical protein